MNPSLRVKRAELADALNRVTKTKGIVPSVMAVLTFDGRDLCIRLAGLEVRASADGFWPGQAQLQPGLLASLGAGLPAGDPVELAGAENLIRVGTFSMPCRWDTSADSRIEVPLDAALLTVLRIARRHSPDEIARSGLTKLAGKAEQEMIRRYSTAVDALTALGVPEAEIRKLVEASLSAWDRPLTTAEAAVLADPEPEDKDGE